MNRGYGEPFLSGVEPGAEGALGTAVGMELFDAVSAEEANDIVIDVQRKTSCIDIHCHRCLALATAAGGGSSCAAFVPVIKAGMCCVSSM